MNTGSGLPGWKFDARMTTFLCKNVTVVKSKEEKTGCTLPESSKESYVSKRAVLPMMMTKENICG
jgi:hypothetical protein